jgi:hypothetical protein
MKIQIMACKVCRKETCGGRNFKIPKAYTIKGEPKPEIVCESNDSVMEIGEGKLMVFALETEAGQKFYLPIEEIIPEKTEKEKISDEFNANLDSLLDELISIDLDPNGIIYKYLAVVIEDRKKLKRMGML